MRGIANADANGSVPDLQADRNQHSNTECLGEVDFSHETADDPLPGCASAQPPMMGSAGQQT